MRDVALKLDIFANEEGKIICNGNLLSYFGISTNYQGQDQIPTQIWKLSREQGRDETTIQQITSCPVTKKKGNPSYYTLPKLITFSKTKKEEKKTTNSISLKNKGTLQETIFLKRNLPSAEINSEMEPKPETTEPW